MKIESSNKFDLCYIGQVNSLGWNQVYIRNGQIDTFGGIIYFAGDGIPKHALKVHLPTSIHIQDLKNVGTLQELRVTGSIKM